jgi:hypothetical protein
LPGSTQLAGLGNFAQKHLDFHPNTSTTRIRGVQATMLVKKGFFKKKNKEPGGFLRDRRHCGLCLFSIQIGPPEGI